MTTIRQQLAEFIRQADNRNEISRATGIDPATLARIATGERQPSGDSIDSLAAYFKMELRPARRARRQSSAK